MPTGSAAGAPGAAGSTTAGLTSPLTSSISAFWAGLIGDIENLAERGGFIVLAVLLIGIGVVGFLRHKGDVAAGAAHVGRIAKGAAKGAGRAIKAVAAG